MNYEIPKPTSKVCNKCHMPKPFSEFSPNKKCSYGLQNACKICTNQYMLAYRNNKPEARDKQREYMTKYNNDPDVLLRRYNKVKNNQPVTAN